MSSYLKSDIRAGAMIVFCFILLGGLIFYVGGFKNFETFYAIRVLSDSAYGVGKSSVVTYSGVKVGEVKSLRVLSESEIKSELLLLRNPTYTVDDVRVEMMLKVSSNVVLRQDSKAKIVGTGLVGDQTIDLTPGSFEKATLPKGSTIVGVSLTGFGKLQKGIGKIDFGVLVSNARQIITNLLESSKKVRSTMDKVEGLLNDLDRTSQISAILNKTESLIDGIDQIVKDNSSEIRNAVSNFNQVSNDLREEMRPILSSLKSFSANADSVLAESKKDIHNMVSELQSTAANMKQFSTKVKKYPWTIFRKTKVASQDAYLFPTTSGIQFEKVKKPAASSEEKKKPFIIF